jgi:hypothetical protein
VAHAFEPGAFRHGNQTEQSTLILWRTAGHSRPVQWSARPRRDVAYLGAFPFEESHRRAPLSRAGPQMGRHEPSHLFAVFGSVWAVFVVSSPTRGYVR